MDTSLTKFIGATLLIILFTALEQWTKRPHLAMGCLVVGVVGLAVLLWLTFWTVPTVAAPKDTTTEASLAPAPAANILPEGTYTSAKISAGDYDFFNYRWAIGQLNATGTTTPITDWRVVNRVTNHTIYESGNLADSTLVVGGPNGLTIGPAGSNPSSPQYVVNAKVSSAAKKQLVLTATGELQLQDATTGAVLYTVKD